MKDLWPPQLSLCLGNLCLCITLCELPEIIDWDDDAPLSPPPSRECLPLLSTVTNRKCLNSLTGCAAGQHPLPPTLLSFLRGKVSGLRGLTTKALALRSPLCRRSSATQLRTHSVPHERPEDVTQEASEMKFLRSRALQGERGGFYKSQFNDQALIQSLKRPKHLRWPVPAVGQAAITQLSSAQLSPPQQQQRPLSSPRDVTKKGLGLLSDTGSSQTWSLTHPVFDCYLIAVLGQPCIKRKKQVWLMSRCGSLGAARRLQGLLLNVL